MNALRRLVTLLFLVASAAPLRAHEGPPFPVFVDKGVGPYTLSVWADPDVGIGTFFVNFDPPAYRSEQDPRVSVEVWPATERLQPVACDAHRQPDRAYKAEVKFDSEEPWKVRVRVEGSLGTGATEFEVLVTPPGYGRWDLLIYFTPFALLGLLWAAVALKRRRLLSHAA